MRHATRTAALLLAMIGTAISAEEETSTTAKPTAEIRSPKSGEKLSQKFRVKGKTANVPKGHMVIVFRSVEGEEEFMFPCTKPFRGNRAFSETIEYRETDSGRHSIEVCIMPEDIAEKINEWREKIIKWYEKGKKGNEPQWTPAWAEKTKTLAWVEYTLER